MWKKDYSLKEFTDASEFKSYADLEKRLNAVLNQSRPAVAPEVADEEEEIVTATNTPAEIPVASAPASVNEDDDALSYFQKLAEE